MSNADAIVVILWTVNACGALFGFLNARVVAVLACATIILMEISYF